MSRLYGKAIQAGYLVDALEPAIRFWADTLGVGPFFIMPPPQFAWLKNQDADASDSRIIEQVALGQSGDLQIELIVPGPAPSTYRDFLDSGGRGLHHLGMAAHHFDAQRAAALAAGMTIATEGASQRTRIAYLQPPPDDAGQPRGPIIELIDMVPVMTGIFTRVREASQAWDGSDPVRTL